MIRSIATLILVTTAAAFLTLGCNQQEPATDTGDTKTTTEETSPAANPSQDDTASETPEEGDMQKDAQVVEEEEVIEWQEGTEEVKKKNIERQRKELIDQQMDQGLYTGIEDEPPTVKVHVADSYHDLSNKDKRFYMVNMFAYYSSVNPEITSLMAYDQNTGRQIAEVDSEGYTRSHNKKDKDKKKKKKNKKKKKKNAVDE